MVSSVASAFTRTAQVTASQSSEQSVGTFAAPCVDGDRYLTVMVCHRYLYPPSVRPDFSGDESQLAWVVSRRALQTQPPLECTIHAGQAIYFPDAFWHATLNLADYNVFASVFTHETPRRSDL